MVTCDDLVRGATGINRCCRGCLSASDANVTSESPLLLVTGGPGTGKTEAVVHYATTAAMQGARVLIGCPMGALFDTNRQRLEANENIVIQTFTPHSKWQGLPIDTMFRLDVCGISTSSCSMRRRSWMRAYGPASKFPVASCSQDHSSSS